MSSYREPCMCGALDCVRCYGPAAKFSGWCDDCIHAEEGECDPDDTIPGSADCRRQQDVDDSRIDDWEARQQAKEFENRQEQIDRRRDERKEG